MDPSTKATYAADILYLTSMCLSELSVLYLLRLITPAEVDRRMILGVESFIVLWTFIALLVSIVNCGAPTPWDWIHQRCLNIVWRQIKRQVMLQSP